MEKELGSEPETRAAMYFMLKHYKNVYAYVNLHSQGRVIYAGKPNLSTKFNKITSKFAKDIAKKLINIRFMDYLLKKLAREMMVLLLTLWLNLLMDLL
ncbi:MAG: hypothetical protein L6V81_06520 [Clostridium sp.]|nr:MAG: hypothetical protein L6V81_06520 [Clostridium sp.]